MKYEISLSGLESEARLTTTKFWLSCLCIGRRQARQATDSSVARPNSTSTKNPKELRHGFDAERDSVHGEESEVWLRTLTRMTLQKNGSRETPTQLRKDTELFDRPGLHFLPGAENNFEMISNTFLTMEDRKRLSIVDAR